MLNLRMKDSIFVTSPQKLQFNFQHAYSWLKNHFPMMYQAKYLQRGYHKYLGVIFYFQNNLKHREQLMNEKVNYDSEVIYKNFISRNKNE